MKKTILIFAFLMLWASPVVAAQLVEGTSLAETAAGERLEAFEGRISLGYRIIDKDGNSAHAGEYDYLRSSAAGALDFEWDPLPHRLAVESYYLNTKDYFAETDYAFKDIVLFNWYTRDMYHNLNHLTLGPYNPASPPPTPSFTDLNPGALYGVENTLNNGFIRFKTPDFPFHLYANMWTVEREGTIQQIFLRGFSGIDQISQSRDIDWFTRQVTVGANSHIGPVEIDYSHMDKRFTSYDSNVLYDTYAIGPIRSRII